MCNFTLEDFEALKLEDNFAYKKLFKLTYQETVKTLVKKGGASLADAKNCFQEAILKFVYMVRADRVQYESCVKLKGYVYKIAWRLFTAPPKKGTRTKEISSALSIAATDPLEEKEKAAEKKRKLKIIWEALQKMKAPCQGILTDTIVKSIAPKYLFEKYGYKNLNSFKDRKSRCLKKLRGML